MLNWHMWKGKTSTVNNERLMLQKYATLSLLCTRLSAQLLIFVGKREAVIAPI